MVHAHPHGGSFHSMMRALRSWVDYEGLQLYINVESAEMRIGHTPGGKLHLRVPIEGMLRAAPELDTSDHGRPYEGILFHGTSWSHLAAILTSGCILRSSVSTRGKFAIWAGEELYRARMYSPPLEFGNIQLQCILQILAQRVKASHFTSNDKQLMLRECWHQVEYLHICEHTGSSSSLYRSTQAPRSERKPRFVWQAAFSNWDALPQPWVVFNNDQMLT